MASPVAIVYPKNNFIKFHELDAVDESGACCDDGMFCLPVLDETDVKFQFRRVFSTQSEAFAMATADGKVAQLCLLKGTGNTSLTWAANLLRNFFVDDGLEFLKTITGPGEVTFYWAHGIPTISGKTCDECFELAMIIQAPGEESQDVTHISNCIKKICDPCYSTVIEWLCDDDTYDFRYCQFDDGAANRIRLPFYLYKPQGVTDKSVYVRSDGSSQVTRSVTMQEWSGIVDYMPRDFHFALLLALESDLVFLWSEPYTGGFRCNNSYAIDWTDESECVAQANFKGNTTPYDARNTNCQVCADCPEILNFVLGGYFWDPIAHKLSFTFTYTMSDPQSGFVILEWKLSTDTVWQQSIQANISPINLLLDPGIYDFRIIPQADNCLPDYSEQITGVGDDDPITCQPITGLIVYDITTGGATGQWNATTPTPPCLYDWELLAADGVTVVQSGIGYWNPGTLILGLFGLDPDTDYTLRVRANCCDGDYSTWSGTSFRTASDGDPEPPGGLMVSLSRVDVNTLRGTISGGTPPYTYEFFNGATGSACAGVTGWTNHDGTTSGTTVDTDYVAAPYQDSEYEFWIGVSDSSGPVQNASSNHITESACLVPETLIMLNDNTEKPLADLKTGIILSGDNEITGFAVRWVKHLMHINGDLLKSSMSHMHILHNGKKVPANMLKVGDSLVDQFGQPVTIDTIDVVDGHFQVINISTANRTYIANGILTHNKLLC